MDINDLYNKVAQGVDENWSDLYKMRYIYLAVGKYLIKNTDFFYSVDKKLGNQNLNISELSNIYNDEKNSGDLKVICKSAALILKYLFSKFNIESKLVQSTNKIIAMDDNENLDIYHWFLAAKDKDTNQTYFMTLISDLPYIKLNMSTKHFGNNISYLSSNADGSVTQNYQGEEIKNTFIPPETLKKIDIDLGYINSYYNTKNGKYNLSEEVTWTNDYNDYSLRLLNTAMIANNYYLDVLIYDTRFYKSLTNFNVNGKNIDFTETKLSDITKEDWDKFKDILVIQIVNYFSTKYPDTYFSKEYKYNYDEWLKTICLKMENYILNNNQFNKDINELKISDEFNFKKWSRNLKKAEKNNIADLDILMKLDYIINNLTLNLNNSEEHFDLAKFIKQLAIYFVNPDFLPNDDINTYVTNSYIAHKLYKLFPIILDCDHKSEFNNGGYNEQIVIIKEILNNIFLEINYTNSNICQYNENYSNIENRIHMYSIKNKTTNEYALIFNVIANQDISSENDYYFIYDMKNNTFKVADILNISLDYIIISNRLKGLIEDLEARTKGRYKK